MVQEPTPPNFLNVFKTLPLKQQMAESYRFSFLNSLRKGWNLLKESEVFLVKMTSQVALLPER